MQFERKSKYTIGIIRTGFQALRAQRLKGKKEKITESIFSNVLTIRKENV